jgi:hypothetical protein
MFLPLQGGDREGDGDTTIDTFRGMRMKKILIGLALLLTAICLAPAAEARKTAKSPEPPLDLTLDWIKQKIGLYQDVRIENAKGHAMTETYAVTRINGCSMEISIIETDDDAKVSTLYEVPLSDYRSFDAAKDCRMFTIYTSGNSVTYSRQVERTGIKVDSTSGAGDHVVIFTRKKDLDNCDLQKRLKKAFDHAGELCVTKAPKDQSETPKQTRKKKKKTSR